MYPQKRVFNSKMNAPPALTTDLLGAKVANNPNNWPMVKLNEKNNAKYIKNPAAENTNPTIQYTNVPKSITSNNICGISAKACPIIYANAG